MNVYSENYISQPFTGKNEYVQHRDMNVYSEIKISQSFTGKNEYVRQTCCYILHKTANVFELWKEQEREVFYLSYSLLTVMASTEPTNVLYSHIRSWYIPHSVRDLTHIRLIFVSFNDKHFQNGQFWRFKPDKVHLGLRLERVECDRAQRFYRQHRLRDSDLYYIIRSERYVIPVYLNSLDAESYNRSPALELYQFSEHGLIFISMVSYLLIFLLKNGTLRRRILSDMKEDFCRIRDSVRCLYEHP